MLDQHPRLTLCPSTQVIAMDERPAQAVRSKPDSSMAVCARFCKEGRADGWISAGNSGAIMATALFIQGRIRGVERPALGSIVPIKNGFADFLFRSLREEIPRTFQGKVGGALIRDGVQRLRGSIDWREFGGAPLLGIDGVAVVAHGRSDARAIKNAIRVTKEAVENQLVRKIRAEVGR